MSQSGGELKSLIEAFKITSVLCAHFIEGIDVKKSFFYIFNALHGTQTRSSDENSVRLSVRLIVRLSNEWIVSCDKTENNMSRFLRHMKDHLT